MRPQAVIGALAATSLAMVLSCSAENAETGVPRSVAPSTTVGPTALAARGEAEDQLSILAPSGYIRRGPDSNGYEWVDQFEAETGCVVSIEETEAEGELTTELSIRDDIDVVIASGADSMSLMLSGTVQPLNDALLGNDDAIDPRLRDGAWYTHDGMVYGVPYQWGPTVLLYDTTVFATPPDSWDVLFTEQPLPDGAPNNSRIQSYNGPLAIADAALVLRATRPELGIDDPFLLDQTQFAEVVSLLRKRQPLLNRRWEPLPGRSAVGFWNDTTNLISSPEFAQDGSVAAAAWVYQTDPIGGQDGRYAWTIPEEGVSAWADTTMVASDAPHPNCAYLWLDLTLDPSVQASVTSGFRSLPAVPAACDLRGADACPVPIQEAELNFWVAPTDDCLGDGRRCVPFTDWMAAYAETS